MASFELRALQREDYAAAGELMSRVLGFGGEPVAQTWFPYWWDENPYLDEATPRGWVVAAADKEIVGVMANIPVPYTIDGKPGLCCAAGSLAVHPDWRGQGLARLIGEAYLSQTRPELLIGTNSSEPARKLWASLGMVSLPYEWPETCPAIPVSRANAAQAALLRRKVPKLLARSVHRLLAVTERTARHRSSEITRQLEPFAPEEDQPLLKCVASSAAVTPLRDARTLNWLYFSTDFARRTRFVVTARRNGDVVGYAAFKQLDAQSLSMLECRCLDGDITLARELIEGAGELWSAAGGSSILCWPYTAMIAEALPADRPSNIPIPSFVYKSNAREFDSRSWERTPADGDMALF